jgi:hypothetical protein
VLPEPGKPSQPQKAKFTATLGPIMATKFHPGLQSAELNIFPLNNTFCN